MLEFRKCFSNFMTSIKFVCICLKFSSDVILLSILYAKNSENDQEIPQQTHGIVRKSHTSITRHQ